jgi:hypoxanthine-guanine phosphoribosyltransferase
MPGTATSGDVRLVNDLDLAIDGKHVVIVEDIVDSGTTLQYLQEILQARNPRSLATVCLLSKPARRLVDVKVDYIGFTIETASSSATGSITRAASETSVTLRSWIREIADFRMQIAD